MRTKFMPTRDKNVEIYADLDKVLEEPLYFRCGGKVHKLKPVTLEYFYKFTNANVKFFDLKSDEQVTPESVVDIYYEVVSSICDTISKEDIKELGYMKIGLLYNLISEHVHGRSHNVTPEELKKKTMMMFKT
jgi:hypothetical protein